MVLSNGYGQQWLHKWSKRGIGDQKTILSLQGNPSSTRIPELRTAFLTSLRGVYSDSTHVPTFGTAATSEGNPKIPDPALFRFASRDREVDGDITTLPSAAECAAHLELLEAFYHIRVKVLSSRTLDAVLGIEPERRTVYRAKYLGYRRGYKREEVTLCDKTFPERRKAKWPFYLSLATVRFLRWAEAVEKALSTDSRFKLLYLPPIDVLMVLHSLLLNPSWFRTFKTPPLKNLYAMPFPWSEIHQAIDADKSDWPYNPPAACSTWFRDMTGLEPDLFEFLVKGNKSTELQQLLKRQGSTRPVINTYRILTVEDVDAVLCGAAVGPHEIPFLRCCRDAVSKELEDTTTNLFDAVQRQASFVDKMESQLWIRSPAVEGTLQRAIDRYAKFLKLFQLYPRETLVPTLDVDLVWHTHQCSPSRYEAGVVKMAGRFIDHNDKLGKTVLNTGFTRTRDLYRIRFGQDYQICHCWDCETLLSAATASSSDPRVNNDAIARRVLEDVAYHRAVEIARQKGHTHLPIRI